MVWVLVLFIALFLWCLVIGRRRIVTAASGRTKRPTVTGTAPFLRIFLATTYVRTYVWGMKK